MMAVSIQRGKQRRTGPGEKRAKINKEKSREEYYNSDNSIQYVFLNTGSYLESI
ncbi:MAG: hypothetical protein ACFFD4_00280 [Candidatus Odinarchaeota archaeon]